jgi:predicted methyltransferase
MRRLIVAMAALLAAGCTTMNEGGAPSGTAAQAAIAAAVADAGRPEADRARDAERKPAEMLALAGIRPGSVVIEMLPGGGYFTRIFSKAVGPTGHVYAEIGNLPPRPGAPPPPVTVIAADPAYSNVTVTTSPFTALTAPTPADVVWTSQNYHDLHLARFNLDVAAVNRSVFNALRPGGLYVVLDHAAAPGSPVTVADTLHRIDPAIVRREVEAAGFVFVSESNAVRNPADPHTANVFDPAIRGHTDQFILVFRRPR